MRDLVDDWNAWSDREQGCGGRGSPWAGNGGAGLAGCVVKIAGVLRKSVGVKITALPEGSSPLYTGRAFIRQNDRPTFDQPEATSVATVMACRQTFSVASVATSGLRALVEMLVTGGARFPR